MNTQPSQGVFISRSSSLITYSMLPAPCCIISVKGMLGISMDRWIQVCEVKVACECETLLGVSTSTVHTALCRLWLLNIQKLQNLGKLTTAHRYKLTHIQISGNEKKPILYTLLRSSEWFLPTVSIWWPDKMAALHQKLEPKSTEA